MKHSHSFRVLAALVAWSASAPGLHAQAVGPDYPIPPSLEYGDLYFDAELGSLFPDSKTFPDLVPSGMPSDVTAAYDAAKGAPGFDLANFVNGNFSGPTPAGPTVTRWRRERSAVRPLEADLTSGRRPAHTPVTSVGRTSVVTAAFSARKTYATSSVVQAGSSSGPS